VLRLVRVSVGPVELGDLKKGFTRKLTPDEKRALDGNCKASAHEHSHKWRVNLRWRLSDPCVVFKCMYRPETRTMSAVVQNKGQENPRFISPLSNRLALSVRTGAQYGSPAGL